MTSRDERATWSIADLADEYDVTHRTIRHYEALGLLSPERRGTTRVFHRRDRTRLALILRGRRIGMDLQQIRHIIDMYDETPGEAGQLRYLLDEVAQRRVELERRRQDIDETLAELAQLEARCRDDLAALDQRSGAPLGR